MEDRPVKLDILAIAAHPDDAELGCGGTLLRHIAAGRTAGILDLTRGELGTRGTVETRAKEAENAAVILGLSVRENLGMADGFFSNDSPHQLQVIRILRKYRPSIVLATAPQDRHPDHGKAAALVRDSCFLSGLVKVETDLEGKAQEPWRPAKLYHYIQDRLLEPDLIVDISGFMPKKMEAIKAFRSQFYDPGSTEPDTYISSERFLDQVQSRASEMGHRIGVDFGEGFIGYGSVGVNDLFDIV